AGLLGLAAVAGLCYFGLISPKQYERTGLMQQNDALQAELLKARADEANLRAFRLQAAALRKRLEVAKQRLPSKKEIPGLYRQISDLAFQSGLAVALFAPKPPEDRDIVAEVPITIISEGSYHQFGGFFARMGRLARIVTLGDFRMAGIDRPTGTLRADLTLATYIFRAEDAPPLPKPGGAAAAPPATPAAPPAQPGAKPDGATR
ncbi:MAG: type 4a pilus biogenesis protein PilO, partial [Gemmatimonadales bacterium]